MSVVNTDSVQSVQIDLVYVRDFPHVLVLCEVCVGVQNTKYREGLYDHFYTM